VKVFKKQNVSLMGGVFYLVYEGRVLFSDKKTSYSGNGGYNSRYYGDKAQNSRAGRGIS